MTTPHIDWEAIDCFLEALGRNDDDARLIFTVFPPQQGPCIHIPCTPGNIPKQAIIATLARRPRYSLGLIINPSLPVPDHWGSDDSHYFRKPDGTRGRLKTFGAQQDHILHGIAIWAEADGGLPIEAQEALPQLAGLPEPTFSIWSGGKSLHHYWVFTPGQEIPLPLFRNLQKRLAHAIQLVAPDAKADDSLSNPNRVMRCPGAAHPATNQLARFHANTGITYTADELDQALPDLPPDARSTYDGAATPSGGGRLSQWFNSLQPHIQRSLAVELLALIPPRQAPGTGTYPAAFATLAALVHHFGPDETIAICDEAGWRNEHWNPAQKVRQIGPARLIASIGKLVARAQEEAGWVRPEHLPPFPDAEQHIIDGFDVHEQTVGEPIPQPELPSSQRHHLSRQDCLSALQQAVDDDIGPADIELLVDELAAKSDLSHYTLKALLSAVRTQAEQLQVIEVEAETLSSPPQPAPQDRIRLANIFPPITAYALGKLTQYLPYSEASVAMAFLACISGLTKLGTSVCGNPITQYTVPTNLYVATVASTGQKKTPLQKITIENPTKDIRLELAKANTRAIENWREQCQGTKKDERPPEPTAIYLHIQDYTGEALAAQLQALDARGQSITVLRDELSGLFGTLNQYRSGRGADEQQLLELFDGLPHTSLRVASGDRSFSRCHVSIYGGIQPEVLKGLIRGGDPSGKWARFIFSPLPRRTRPLPTVISQQEVGEIAESNGMLSNAASNIYTMPPRTYHLDPEALVAFSSYEHTKQQEALNARLQAQQAVKGKAGGKVLRVAGLLHILWATESGGTPSPSIPYATLQSAIDIIEAHDSWALTFHESALTEDESPVSNLMRRIHTIAQRIGRPCVWKEISSRMPPEERSKLNSAIARAAMEALARHGYGTTTQGSRGGLIYEPARDLPAA
jgi:hypothetical protein